MICVVDGAAYTNVPSTAPSFVPSAVFVGGADKLAAVAADFERILLITVEIPHPPAEGLETPV